MTLIFIVEMPSVKTYRKSPSVTITNGSPALSPTEGVQLVTHPVRVNDAPGHMAPFEKMHTSPTKRSAARRGLDLPLREGVLKMDLKEPFVLSELPAI